MFCFLRIIKEHFQKNSVVHCSNVSNMYSLLRITKSIFRKTQPYIVLMCAVCIVSSE